MDLFGMKRKSSKVVSQDEELKLKENVDDIINVNKDDKNNVEVYSQVANMNEIEIDKRIDKRLPNSRLSESIMNRIEYDMTENKKKASMLTSNKKDMELMRRWVVKIYNIYITPQEKMLDPFLQFTIGGNYKIQVLETKEGNKYKVQNGERGYSDKTEVVENVDVQEKRPYNKIIETEMRMSYSMVEGQKLMVEVWDYNSMWMNTIIGYSTMHLEEIVNGDMNLTLMIYRKDNKMTIPQAKIEFKIIFQEIWDFKLSFVTWTTGNLLPPKKVNHKREKLPSAQIILELMNIRHGQKNTKVETEICKNSATPYFSNIKGEILYRGCVNDLENQSIRVTLINQEPFFSKILCTKEVVLRGIIEDQRIKTDVLLVDEETNEKYSTNIQGFVNIDHKIKHKQYGDNITLISTRKYLCVNIMRCENIRPAENRGIVDSFITVEWCGSIQRTRTVVENNSPSFNEILYFQVPFPEEYILKPDKYLTKINNEFSSKNEVVFNLMIEGDDGSHDNLGITIFHLSEIKNNGYKSEKIYFAENLKCEKRYITRVYSGKSKLFSAFSNSINSFVHFEIWFLDDFPDEVDFGEKRNKNQILDKVPQELQVYFEFNKDYFFNLYKNKIADTFTRYTMYSYKNRLFNNIIVQDQYTNLHLLPYYLCLVTPPEKVYPIDEEGKNPNFFDCNLRTLDEVAHYIKCFPFSSASQARNDIWTSPDFLLKVRKGDIEDHAILMACLMMGLRKDIIFSNPKQEIRDEIEITNFPNENRVFICLGKLRRNRTTYVWIMTVMDDYKGVIFWEPQTGAKYELKYRVDNAIKLKNFLDGKYIDYESCKKNIVNKKVIKEKEEIILKDVKKRIDSSDFNEKKIPGTGDNGTEINFSLDHFKDEIINDEEIFNFNYDKIALKSKQKESVYNYKEKMGFYDDFVIKKNSSNLCKLYEFNIQTEQKEQIDKNMRSNGEQNLVATDDFKNEKGMLIDNNINLPFETIDIIFNRRNIYANIQYHDPAHIKYNLYDSDCWLPYINLKDGKIWNDNFEAFYSMTNFTNQFSSGLIHRMREGLIKEIRVGITAARSGMNLQTKFKKKNEQINTILAKYLDYLEERALNRIDENVFKLKIEEWEDMIKSRLPKFYQMEAKSIFFNYYDLEGIRREINDDLETFYNSKIKNLIFATSAKIYPYFNQIVSVRIIIAKFHRILEEDIVGKEDLMLYKEEFSKGFKEIQEENDDEEEVEAAVEEIKDHDSKRSIQLKEKNLKKDTDTLNTIVRKDR